MSCLAARIVDGAEAAKVMKTPNLLGTPGFPKLRWLGYLGNLLIHLLQLPYHLQAAGIKGVPGMVHPQVVRDQHIPALWLVQHGDQTLYSSIETQVGYGSFASMQYSRLSIAWRASSGEGSGKTRCACHL